MTVNYNAYMDQDLTIESTKKGKLSDLIFSVKDVFSIKGYTCSAGNPDWLRTHSSDHMYASSIVRLLENGATLKGTTITDEIMYSLNGVNFHYGTPINPKDPERIPGGSSSGSGVAVSAEIVDFALGTDTGGSVRIPSSYCGIYGIRPTHGFVPIDGVVPLAQSFDTVGWMARDPKLLLEVGEVLLPLHNLVQKDFSRLIIAEDAWNLAESETKEALLPFIEKVKNLFQTTEEVTLSTHGLQEWQTTFRMIQGLEIWKTHGEWINEVNPTFGQDIGERFQWASTLTDEEVAPYLQKREQICNKMYDLVQEDTLIIIPTAPGAAPLLNMSGEESERKRAQTMQLSCIAGLSGLPQVTIPVAEINGAPIGLSFIAASKQDLRLLKWVNNYKELWK
ncbi:amidase [Bacillus sp. 03113]|uniref:amidase n=1 Tax=Bacillus sp. 03113 TaxID=2578211 RepID=UPI00114274F3|nr:amidase [Bacillus sp. 03113]